MFSQTLRRAAAQSVRSSPLAGRFTPSPHIGGYTINDATKFGGIAATFGVSAGVFALFFFGEVPRVPLLNESSSSCPALFLLPLCVGVVDR
ncbi:hypothetical protein BDW67DRAFT_144635 [Aspergillus spinulosporus]